MAYVIQKRTVETIDSVPIEQISEEWLGYIPDRPFSSEEFCRQHRPDDDLELISGMVVQRPMVQWDHEKCFMWLATVLNTYVSSHDLDVMAGSRTALEINPFQVRLPDLMFIRKDNPAELRQRGVRGAPDLPLKLYRPATGPEICSHAKPIIAPSERQRSYLSIKSESAFVRFSRRTLPTPKPICSPAKHGSPIQSRALT